jgi:hypothetical protein
MAQSGHHERAKPCPRLGVNGHCLDMPQCLLLTQSGHDYLYSAWPS